METDKIVLSTSDEAAQLVTGISGWVARGGRFWGDDERMARYDGCTHRPCNECGKPVAKITGYMLCADCRKKVDDSRFADLERREWDGQSPLTLFDGDEYFFDSDKLEEWCNEHDTTPQELQLVFCKPNYAREIDDDFYCDDLPDDQTLEDVAPGLADAIKSVNEYINKHRPILSWSPSNIAAIIKE